MSRIFVGVSEYGKNRGKSQFCEYRAGLQLLAVLAIVNPQLPTAERITINEAQRPRADQTAFWNDMLRRGAPPAVVAARPFSSKHDGGPNDDEGRAYDLGGQGGSVITDRAHALFKAVALEYGIHHTGAGFRPAEKWHFEYVPGTARKLASAAPTPQEAEEQHMTARLYRNATSGLTAVIDPTEGYYWPCPNPDYVTLVRKLKMVPDEDPLNIPQNQWDFLIGRTDEHRNALAARVWSVMVAGFNGPQTAAARLAGIDKKAGTAKLDATGLVVHVDEASLVGKITTAVKAMFTNGGK